MKITDQKNVESKGIVAFRVEKEIEAPFLGANNFTGDAGSCTLEKGDVIVLLSENNLASHSCWVLGDGEKGSGLLRLNFSPKFIGLNKTFFKKVEVEGFLTK